MQLLALLFGMQAVAGEDENLLHVLETMGLGFIFILGLFFFIIVNESLSRPRGRNRGL